MSTIPGNAPFSPYSPSKTRDTPFSPSSKRKKLDTGEMDTIPVEKENSRFVLSPNSKIQAAQKREEILRDAAKITDLTLQNKPFLVKHLNSGVYHDVYDFVGAGSITHLRNHVDVSKLVFRVVKNHLPSKKNPEEIRRLDSAGYKYLSENGIPIPKVYNLGTGILRDGRVGVVVEKMVKNVSYWNWKNIKSIDELSKEDLKALEFAKGFFEKIATNEREIIPDFKPDNVMYDSEGELKVIDWGEGQQEMHQHFQFHVRTSLTQWSQNNKEVFEFLTKNISEDFKKKYLEDYFK